MCGNRKKIRRKCRIHLYRLPSGKRSLYWHIKRVNYQTARLKRSHIKIPEIPSPAPVHEWVTSDDGLLEPQWCDGDILPQEVVDIIQPDAAEDRGDSDEGDDDEGSDSEEDADDPDSNPDSDYSDSDM